MSTSGTPGESPRSRQQRELHRQPKQSPDSRRQATTKRASRVRSATDDDLARVFSSSKLLIGFPVTPNEPTPPSSAAASDDRSPETQRDLEPVQGPHRVSPHRGECEIHLRPKP
jgi:hypothetical protein